MIPRQHSRLATFIARSGLSRTRILASGVGIVVVVYVAQCATPLRLNTDSMFYLSAAAQGSAQGGGLFPPLPEILPPGYPALIAALEWVGLGTPLGFVLLNIASLLIGLAALFTVSRERWDAKLAAALLTLLSFSTVKHVTLPQSDVPFLGASLVALAVAVELKRSKGRRFALLLLVAIALTAGAISIRTVGIALLPAIVFAIVRGGAISQAFANLEQAPRRVIVAMGIVLVAVLAAAVGRKYLRAGAGELGTNLAKVPRMRVAELGELALNVPESKMPPSLAFLIIGVGILAIAGVLYALWSAAHRPLEVPDVYLCSYLAILSIWPFRDNRFWVPVLPVLALRLLGQVRRSGSRPGGAIVAAVLAWFIVSGVAALTYSTGLSYSCEEFPDRYGSGALAPAYRQFLRGEERGDRERSTVALLEHYSGAGLFCAWHREQH